MRRGSIKGDQEEQEEVVVQTKERPYTYMEISSKTKAAVQDKEGFYIKLIKEKQIFSPR